MTSKKQTNQLDLYVQNLTRSFERWDYLFEYGGSDPFYPDGANLNLVRNHILSWKRQIDELLKDDQENTLFSLPYPDIYYKPTPEEVPYDYMANPDEIRARAAEQLALYEQDPDFCYIRDHYKEAFPHGETKTTKAAGIYPGQFSRFVYLQNTVERDDLVEMRNRFWKSYEEQLPELKECANKLRTFLSVDHSHDDNTPIVDDCFEDEYTDEVSIENGSDELFKAPRVASDVSTQKSSLDEQIQVARAKAVMQDEPYKKEREEQLTLF